ncbi:MAG: phosphatase PAP2 family protein [Actinomycetota bacterium]
MSATVEAPTSDAADGADGGAAPRTPEPAQRRAVGRVRGQFRRRPWTFEVMLFVLGVLVYQGSRALVVGDAPDALANAADIVAWERSTGLFVETSIQEFVLTHLSLTKALNLFYLYGHYTITPIFFIWLYRKRRHWYPLVRNAFFTANGIALIVFMVFPVAPPRYLRSDGFIDTLRSISDIDLHAGSLAGWFNPYAAVPSMHFGYSLMIGLVLCFLIRSWPLRLVALVYPALVFLTITGTANHYVIDSMAGSLVIGTGFLMVSAWMWARPRLAHQRGPSR